MNEDEIRSLVTTEVDRHIREFYEKQNARISEEISGHRQFLQHNTRWVVVGFFGLLVIFGAFGVWIFGQKLDESIFATIFGEETREEFDVALGSMVSQLQREADSLKETHVAEISAAAEIGIQESESALTDFSEALVGDLERDLVEFLNTTLRRQLQEEVTNAVDRQAAALQDFNAQDLLRTAFAGTAVVGFAGDGCPEGWEPYDPAAGRFILGADSGHRFNSTGGEEEITLTIDQMPQHRHEYLDTIMIATTRQIETSGRLQRAQSLTGPSPIVQIREELNGMSPFTANAGGDEPVDIMPPYIALYWCTPE